MRSVSLALVAPANPRMYSWARTWVIRAAFGIPVVPDVKISSAVSRARRSSRTLRSGGSWLQLFSAWVRSRWSPWAGPRIHCCIGFSSRFLAASNTGEVSASTITWAAPEMFRQWARATPESWLLIRAVTTPIFESPYQTQKYSSRLGMKSATVWPRRRFRPLPQ